MTITGGYIGALTTLAADNGGHLVLDTSFVGPGCVIVARESIRIGPGCQIAEFVTIRDQDHTTEGFATSPITIGDRVWVGAKASILRGSTIGDDAVIGAHSVVKGTVPRGRKALGIPARLVTQPRAC